jgi:Asp-tRNA(Asn)/Glu-tRNA(Gln) amidotransferase A subunit family amidase
MFTTSLNRLQFAPTTRQDLTSLAQDIHNGRLSAYEALEQSIQAAQSAACDAVFLEPTFVQARADLQLLQQLPLAGLAVSIKDLFDMAGHVTRAGSIVRSGAPAAPADALAVARLRQAGACVIGRTNMSEFAFSGVGTNPHFGTPSNAYMTDRARIPGGSSSGAAISVATGAAHIGLGSDTGGSIRIPAALNGLVGFKSTASLVPTSGVLPLSTTLDTVCAVTRSVRDAIWVHEILSGQRVNRQPFALEGAQLAFTETLMLDGADAYIANTFESTLVTLEKYGASLVRIEWPELKELAKLAELGNFSAAESFTWHQQLLNEAQDRYDPRVALRMRRGEQMSASDYIRLIRARADWIERMQYRMAAFDAVLSPTVPLLPCPISEVAPGAAQDEAFFKINALLLRNPSVVNMLDGCALSLPCQMPLSPPCGLMIWHQSMQDDRILNLALSIESCLQRL